jgi:hypothetical protein
LLQRFSFSDDAPSRCPQFIFLFLIPQERTVELYH